MCFYTEAVGPSMADGDHDGLVMLHCSRQPHPRRCSHLLCFVWSSCGESRTVEQSRGKNPTKYAKDKWTPAQLAEFPASERPFPRRGVCTVWAQKAGTYPFMRTGSEYHLHSCCQQRPEGVSAALVWTYRQLLATMWVRTGNQTTVLWRAACALSHWAHLLASKVIFK